MFNALWANDENNESYLGSSYTLNLAFEPSCLSSIGATSVMNKHIGVLGAVRYCDHYTDDAQNYLRGEWMLGTGLAFYSHSIYRDSFFISLLGSLDHANIKDVVNDITGTQIAVSGTAGLGYQWHFQRGYVFSLVIYYKYSKPFFYDQTNDENLNDELSKSLGKLTPTFLIGWRF